MSHCVQVIIQQQQNLLKHVCFLNIPVQVYIKKVKISVNIEYRLSSLHIH